MDDRELEEALAEQLGGAWTAWRSEKASFAQAAVQLSGGKNGRLVVSGLVIFDDAITTDRLKSVPIRALEDEANRARSARTSGAGDLPPLARAGQSPDEFSRLVADHYAAHAAVVAHPVAAMAVSAGVKLPTVHTWVREARLRGYLPPATRGKA